MSFDKRHNVILVVIILTVIGFAVYGRSLTNGFVLDDLPQLVDNPIMHSLGNLPKILTGGTFDSGGAGALYGMYYRPAAAVIRVLLYQAFQLNPIPYHAAQLIIHIANALLIVVLLERFLPLEMSTLLALLFLVHPINAESVVYISALQDTLVLFFGLGALIVTKQPLIYLLLSLSLLSKETGVFFVVILLVWRMLFNKKHILLHTGFSAILTGLYLYLRFFVAHIPLTKHWVAPISMAPLSARLLTVPKEILYYFGKLIYPAHLSFSQHFLVTKPTLEDVFLPITAIIIIILVVIIAMRNASKTRARSQYLIFFLVWFVLSFGLHLNIIPLDMTVADHWFYIPFVGLLGVAGIFITTIRQKTIQIGVLIGLLLVCLPLGFQSYGRSLNWKDGYTLYTHDIRYSPDNFDLENDLAFEQLKRKDYAQALIHAQKSVALAPTFWVNWNTLGAVLIRLGKVDEAISAYRQSMKYSDYYQAYENLAGVLLVYKTPQETVDFITPALNKFPGNTTLWIDLSVAKYQLGEKEEAIAAIRRAYMLAPGTYIRTIMAREEQGLPITVKPDQ